MSKQELVGLLVENGYMAEIQSDLPIVIVSTERTGKQVEKFIKKSGYKGSFGWKVRCEQ